MHAVIIIKYYSLTHPLSRQKSPQKTIPRRIVLIIASDYTFFSQATIQEIEQTDIKERTVDASHLSGLILLHIVVSKLATWFAYISINSFDTLSL